MTAPQQTCPPREQLIAFLKGLESEDRIGCIESHLDHCAPCCRLVEELDQELNVHRIEVPPQPVGGEGAAVPRRVETTDSWLAPCDEHGFIGKIDEYPVRCQIARGGMGIVYRALDKQLERDVALKLLAPELASQPESTQRFLREARAAAVIDHPNILPVYSVRQESFPPYIVMAFDDGETLADRLEREGRLPLDEVVRIGSEIANGLSAAHARNLIHRDIKPANILLSTDGKVRITDFGLARAADSPQLTRSGMIAGTPLFMAPEQIDGVELDARTDLFSLGAVLYMMASGTLPFDGPSTTAIMKRVALEDAPPLSDSPDWFRAIVNRLLEKKAGDRIQTADEAARLLQSRVAPASSAQGRRRWALAAAAAAAALISIGAMAVNRDGTHASRSPAPSINERTFATDWFAEIHGESRKFTSLEEAIQAAEPFSTISVHGTGRILIPRQYITKPVRIRAAKGALPRLEAIDAAVGNVFTASHALILEGLILHQTVTNPKVCMPIVDTTGALGITHCRIVRVWKGEERIIGSPAVIRTGHPNTVITHSEIYAPSSRAIASQDVRRRHNNAQPIDLRLSHNLLSASFILVLDSRFQKPRWSIQMNNNHLLGGAAVVADYGATPAVANFTVDGCVFETNGLFTSTLKWKTLTDNVADVSWLGRNNLYHIKLYFHSLTDDDQYDKFVTSFDRWNRMLDNPEQGSAAIGTPFAAWLPQDFTVASKRVEVEDRLTKEDFELSSALKKKFPDSGTTNLDLIGPGASFDNWRTSEAYAKWEADLMKAAQDHSGKRIHSRNAR